jgi:hypothetical protein
VPEPCVALLVLDAGAWVAFRSRGTNVTAYAHLGYRLFFGEENEGLRGVIAAAGGTGFDPDSIQIRLGLLTATSKRMARWYLALGRDWTSNSAKGLHSSLCEGQSCF